MWSLFSTAFNDWLRHRCPRLGAALAYYAVFSLGPLLLIVSAVAGLWFGAEAVRTSLAREYLGVLGPAGGQAVEAMIASASSSSGGREAAGAGVILLIFAALGVVVQLKDALNTIWEVPDSPSLSWFQYVRSYLISFAGILSIGLLLTISLILSSGLTAFGAWVGIPTSANVLWQALNAALSVSVLTALFALMFKYLPDAPVAWPDVWVGALTIALLFEAGKFALATYIGMQGFESAYGAASSFVVLLVWIYYASQLVLFGAELAHVSSVRRRQGVRATV